MIDLRDRIVCLVSIPGGLSLLPESAGPVRGVHELAPCAPSRIGAFVVDGAFASPSWSLVQSYCKPRRPPARAVSALERSRIQFELGGRSGGERESPESPRGPLAIPRGQTSLWEPVSDTSAPSRPSLERTGTAGHSRWEGLHIFIREDRAPGSPTREATLTGVEGRPSRLRGATLRG